MTDNAEITPAGGVDYATTIPAGIIAASAAANTEVESALSRRFTRSTRKKKELVFEFTKDPGLLHQYHVIYEREFRAMHNPNYTHVEDDHDRRSHFLIVRRGNFVVGGARLSVKTPRQPQALPIEMNGFRVEEHFPYLGQKELSYGQVGRVCLLPEFRDGLTTRMIFWHIHRKSVALGISELFGTATLVSVRSYRQSCRSIGLAKAMIHTDVQLPVYPMCEDIKFYLIRIPLDKAPMEKESDFITEKESTVSENA